jgi:hypothetical protein
MMVASGDGDELMMVGADGVLVEINPSIVSPMLIASVGSAISLVKGDELAGSIEGLMRVEGEEGLSGIDISRDWLLSWRLGERLIVSGDLVFVEIFRSLLGADLAELCCFLVEDWDLDLN